MELRIEDLSKSYPNGVRALDNVSLIPYPSSLDTFLTPVEHPDVPLLRCHGSIAVEIRPTGQVPITPSYSGSSLPRLWTLGFRGAGDLCLQKVE